MRLDDAVLCLAMALCAALTPRSAGAQEVQDQGVLPVRIGDLTYRLTVGDKNSFGAITDAAAIGGRVAVLDGMNNRVMLFNEAGAFLSAFGEKGQGPGEFFLPIGIERMGEELLVLDRANQRLSRFRIEGEDLFLVEEHPIAVPGPGDFCVLGNRVFVVGLVNGHIVHEVSISGEIMNSFGDAAADDFTGGHLSAVADIACSAAGRVLAVSMEVLNRLQIFSVDGTRLWNSPIPGYVQQQFDTSGGRLRPLPPTNESGFINDVAGFEWLDQKTLLLQLGRQPRVASGMNESRVFRLGEGWQKGSSSALPRIVLLDRDRWFLEEVAPFPLLKVYERRQ